MNMLTTFLLFLLMLAVMLGTSIFGKKFIFRKVKINKWIPLTISIILFIGQIFLGIEHKYLSAAVSVVAVVFFFWFMDIVQTGGPKNKGKQIVIKSKAKPNRAKKK